MNVALPSTMPLFRNGAGEPSPLMRAADWSGSPVGPPQTWAPSLRTAVQMLLCAEAEVVLFWGADFTALYNEAYVPTIGDKHPRAFGRPARENWNELWGDLEPLLRQVRETGRSVVAKDRRFDIARHGYLEEVYFDISYSAVPDEDGSVGGVLCIVSETTRRVFAERRQAFLLDLEQRLRGLDDPAALIAVAEREFGNHLGVAAVRYGTVGPDLTAGLGARLAPLPKGGRGLALHDLAADPDRDRLRALLSAAGALMPAAGALLPAAGALLAAEAPGGAPALLLAAAPAPRRWRRDEVGLAVAVAERLHALLARARTAAALRAAETRKSALVELDDRLREAEHPGVAMQVGARILGRTLGGARAGYAVVEDGFYAIERDWTDGRVPSVVGRFAVADFGRAYAERLRLGGWVAIPDLATHPLTADVAGRYAAHGAVSQLSVPLVVGGALSALVYVHDRVRRDWTPEDCDFAREVANRTWEAAARARAEADLRAGEARLRLALEAGRLGRWDLDPVAGRLDASEACRANFGRGPDEPFDYNDLLAAIHPDDRERQQAAVRRVIATGIDLDIEHRVIWPDGSVHWVQMRGQLAALADGAPVVMHGVSQDVTERRETEERVRASEQRLQLAKDAADVGIWDYDVGAGTVRWSERAFRLWGRSPPTESGGTVPIAEMLGAIHPEDREGVRTEILRTLRDGVPFRSEFRVLPEDGAVRWLAALGRWIEGTEPGSSGTMIGVNLDVTARRRVEEELRRLNETLEERVEARTRELVEAQAALAQAQKMEAVGQLTGGIAHDFNNLLTVVTGNMDMARRSVAAGDEARTHRLIANALKGAERAAVLTHRLLAFARRQQLAPDTLAANALVTGMTELLSRTLGELVDLETDLSADLWPARVDPHQLENALLNLAVNARDAMLEGDGLAGGGRLTIATRNRVLDAAAAGAAELAAGRYVEIAVRDTGAGMSDAVRARVFEPFFTTKEQGKGTGLGLAMVFGFMKQSGGSVLIDSAPGSGTTVRLLLPACAADAPVGSAEAAPPEPGPRPVRAATVLLVEDQAEVGDVAEAVLSDVGYRVLRAADGAEAQALLARGEPAIDLLFTDVVMPGGLTGLDLARAARRIRPGLAVLLTTGYANAALHLRGDGQSPAEFPILDKPYRRADLLAKVSEALGALPGAKAPAPSGPAR